MTAGLALEAAGRGKGRTHANWPTGCTAQPRPSSWPWASKDRCWDRMVAGCGRLISRVQWSWMTAGAERTGATAWHYPCLATCLVAGAPAACRSRGMGRPTIQLTRRGHLPHCSRGQAKRKGIVRHDHSELRFPAHLLSCQHTHVKHYRGEFILQARFAPFPFLSPFLSPSLQKGNLCLSTQATG